MKLDNLEVGMVVKNYKELCRLLEISVRSGSQKIRDVKELDSWIKYDRKGNSYIITEIFSEQKPILDGRGLNPKSHNNKACTDYPNLLISKAHWESIGVYKITRGSEIYVGSTAAGFRKRFMTHRGDKQRNQQTYELLNNGGVFEILKECNDMTEKEIRAIERKYIRHYLKLHGCDLINIKETKTYKPKRYKVVKRFDTTTNNMITQYKQGNKLLHEKREKIDSDPDVAKMMELIKIDDKENVNEVR